MTRFLVVPQWQGSPAPRAMLLVDGAEAIAGDLPRSACARVEVPLEAGESLETGVRRFSALTHPRDLVAAALDDDGDGPTMVVGGDCGVAVPAIAHAAARHPALAVVWFDAHADFHTPESSPSGAFAGMALRAVCAPSPLGPASVPPERIVLAGAREFDDGEREALDALGVRVLTTEDLARGADALAEVVAATGADAVHVHVDLDALDPAVLGGLALPVPFGLELEQLTAAIRGLRARIPLVGASIAGFAPATPAAATDDLGSILRVIGALA